MAHTLPTRRRLLAVFCGGFLGTILRYSLSTVLQSWLGKGWPYDILLINLTGACMLATLTIVADASLFIGPTRRLFLTTGLLGAYTTFSSLALGDVLLFHQGAWIPALVYLLLSIPGGIGMVVFGDWLGQRLVARMRQRPGRSKATREPQPIAMQNDLLLPDQVDTPRHTL